ncbi:AAA family ATPase [Longispora albida]|uniref:AAA family ATPase n=1 Tax=Longispora albida TaxID=203523 RepID=UPI00039A3EA7|nr:AAA family ATPase [Longispora albida]
MAISGRSGDTRHRSVVINGDLGSGKSTVSVRLGERLGLRRVSVGDLYRQMAEERGMTALQLNLHAELDDKVDSYVDQLQSDLAASDEDLIVDSRLAWFFFKDALKVHLITEPGVAAVRVLGRPADTVESYRSAAERLASRSESERFRFLSRYGADKTRLRNYDLVCDSTRARPEEIVNRIAEQYPGGGSRTALFIDPARIFPGGAGTPREGPLLLGYARPHFFVLSGERVLTEALRAGHTLVEASLGAEAGEPAGGGDGVSERTAEELFAGLSARPGPFADWEAEHGIRLPVLPA